MTALLGINCGAPADSDPAALAATGARLVRTVYRDNIPGGYRPWLTDLKSRGVECLFVGDSSPESLGDIEGSWPGRMTVARSNYGDLVKRWQWGNESDGDGMASWTMPQARVNRLLETARRVFPRGQYTLIAPGMVTGDPAWLDSVRVDLCDAIDAHPYAKWPGTAPLRDMLNGYLDHGKPLQCLEYDSRTAGMSAYLRDYPGIEAAAVMCWDNAQTDGEGLALGLKQNPAAMADFKAATGGPANHPPAERHAEFVEGFKQIADRHPDIVGTPRESESGPWRNCSMQRTTNGWMVWGNFAGGVGDQKGFVAEDLTRYVWDGAQLVRR